MKLQGQNNDTLIIEQEKLNLENSRYVLTVLCMLCNLAASS